MELIPKTLSFLTIKNRIQNLSKTYFPLLKINFFSVKI